MWAFLVAPMIAAGVVVGFASLKRTSVKLFALPKPTSPPSEAEALRTRSLASRLKSAVRFAARHLRHSRAAPATSITAADAAQSAAVDEASAKALAAMAKDPFTHDESCHWLRRIVSTDIVQTVLVAVARTVFHKHISLLLSKLHARGHLSSSTHKIDVSSITPHLSAITRHDEAGGERHVDFDLSVIVNGRVAVDVEVPLYRLKSLRLWIAVSEVRVAGARIRCHTAGERQGDVEVLDLPSLQFELHSTVGEESRLLHLKDWFIAPILIEFFGRRVFTKFAGLVLRECLTKLVLAALPEECR
jgi:hypothetical protein